MQQPRKSGRVAGKPKYAGYIKDPAYDPFFDPGRTLNYR